MANTVNYSAMTDDEFEKYMTSKPEEEIESQGIEQKEYKDDNSEDTEVNDTDIDTDTETDEKDTGDTIDDVETKESQESEDIDNEQEDTETTEVVDTPDVDYKIFYEQVTSDYKANGKVMPGLKNPEDFKAALAMASNYALKTTALKPHLSRIKTLEKAGVTDDEFNEMLELRARNPEAIKKAMKDAGIDPLDINIDEEINYQPQNYIVPQSEIDFDDIISTIKDTPEFALTTKVVTEIWDEASKTTMLENPVLIKGLNEEIQMGRFEQIQAIIEQKKMLGRTNGMSDLDMYQEIATSMNNQPNVGQPKTPVLKVEDPAIKEQKKQAGINTKKTSSAVKKYDPAKLSDEEFMTLVNSGAKFI